MNILWFILIGSCFIVLSLILEDCSKSIPNWLCTFFMISGIGIAGIAILIRVSTTYSEETYMLHKETVKETYFFDGSHELSFNVVETTDSFTDNKIYITGYETANKKITVNKKFTGSGDCIKILPLKDGIDYVYEIVSCKYRRYYGPFFVNITIDEHRIYSTEDKLTYELVVK